MNESFRIPLCKTNYFSLYDKLFDRNQFKEGRFLWIIAEGNHPTIMKT